MGNLLLIVFAFITLFLTNFLLVFVPTPLKTGAVSENKKIKIRFSVIKIFVTVSKGIWSHCSGCQITGGIAVILFIKIFSFTWFLFRIVESGWFESEPGLVSTPICHVGKVPEELLLSVVEGPGISGWSQYWFFGGEFFVEIGHILVPFLQNQIKTLANTQWGSQ